MRRSPIARTPFRTKPSEGKPLGNTTFKRKAPKKRPGYHDKRMRDACRDQPCYLRYPGICCGDPKTSSPAHSNESEHGKAGGLKARDEFTLPACWLCHAEHDQGKRFSFEFKCTRWRAGYREWEPVRAQRLGLATHQELQ